MIKAGLTFMHVEVSTLLTNTRKEPASSALVSPIVRDKNVVVMYVASAIVSTLVCRSARCKWFRTARKRSKSGNLLPIQCDPSLGHPAVVPVGRSEGGVRAKRPGSKAHFGAIDGR